MTLTKNPAMPKIDEALAEWRASLKRGDKMPKGTTMTDPTYIPLPAGTVLQAGDEHKLKTQSDKWWTPAKFVIGDVLINENLDARRPIAKLPEWAQPAWRRMVEQLEEALQSVQVSEALLKAGRPEIDRAILYMKALLKERDELTADRDSIQRHMDLARAEAGCPDDETLVMHCRELRADRNRLRTALEKQHQWHLEQTERTPVFFGDTIGQNNAEEYQDSELCEMTVKALKGGDARCDQSEPPISNRPANESDPQGGATVNILWPPDALMETKAAKETPTQRVEAKALDGVLVGLNGFQSATGERWLYIEDALSIASDLETALARIEKLEMALKIFARNDSWRMNGRCDSSGINFDGQRLAQDALLP